MKGCRDKCHMVEIDSPKLYAFSNWCSNCKWWREKSEFKCSCCNRLLRDSPKSNLRRLR